MENIDTRATAFGRVLGALMERRGIPDSAGEMRVLFDRSGLGAEKYLARVAGEEVTGLVSLSGLDREMTRRGMEFTEPERVALAEAYVFERDPQCATPGCERPAFLGDELGDCAEHRAAYDARTEYEAWDLAWKILAPWVESAREIGSDELTTVMEEALAKVDEAGERAEHEVRRAEAALDG